MIKIPALCVCLLLLAQCRLPDKWVTGVYINANDDTLRIKTDRSFRVEVLEPDTVRLKQLHFTSGRWHQERRKLYLTVATKSMGEYWQCQPFKVRLRRLKRPVECDEKGKTMVFRKIHLKKKKRPPAVDEPSDKKHRNKSKEKSDEAEQ